MKGELANSSNEKVGYVVDTRPLCQGMPFVLTDAAHPRLVLKHGSHFLVLDRTASIPACNTLGYGYYREDTRRLSQWEILLNGAPLSLLSSSVEEGYAGSFLYTNPQTAGLPQARVTILREVVLSDLLWERLQFQNFHSEELELNLTFCFQSDFADMFEVRGLNRPIRGERMLPVFVKEDSRLFLAYRGLDGLLLETVIELHGIQPSSVREGELKFTIKLPVKQSFSFEISVHTRTDGVSARIDPAELSFAAAREASDEFCRKWAGSCSELHTDNELFDISLNRGMRDLYILRQPTPKGIGLAAGIPWYSSVFGRDSAISAWQTLPFMPELSRECIQVLAAYQGRVEDDFRAEKPGRIMHELRTGELARIGAIPHSPYYGSVDSTQLWLILLAGYVRWSADLKCLDEYWPAVLKALDYLEGTSAEGYISYRRISEMGLENQGWKDSGDSVMHKDGVLAAPPISICEAQSYLYAAYLEVAGLALLKNKKKLAEKLKEKAFDLKEKFNRDFWMEEEGFVAMALDGEGKQVRSLASNPGHCLISGILDEARANRVADRLMSPEFNTGWGLRTLASTQVAYNPISYHNGSVWPHDNAMIAEGLRGLGRIQDVHTIMSGLFDAAQGEADFRLPELFCGFDRTRSSKPIDYPVSCSPQAWAAGSIYQLLAACINFRPDALNGRLAIVEPCLPEWLGTVIIRNIRIGDASVDLGIGTRNGSTSCQVLRKRGSVRIIVET